MKAFIPLITAAGLTSCGGTENTMSIQQQTEQRFKENPHPKEACRI
ncbi:hypothetical protein [Neisseria iguanae]|nr:hypothetical protein [Neisseria iguanae]